MTGGVVKLNGQEITGWYERWKCRRPNENTGEWDHFYTLRKHIESHLEYYKESDEVGESEQYGPRKFYHIVVGDKTLKNGAWEYTSDKAGELKGWVGFRASRIGDPGNPHVDTFERPEGDGVSVEEDWFG